MAKKIDTVFTADPNAGSDPSKKASIAVDFGEGTEEAYSLEQIANVVSDRLDLGSSTDPSTFSMTLGDDTFNAVIAPITGASDYWIIQVDDSTTPTGGGTQGTVPTKYTVADTDIHTYTLFTSSDDSTYTEITPEQTLQYNDTLGPVISTATTYLLEAGTAPATQIKVTVPDASDATGVDRVDLYDTITGKPFQLDLTLGAITEIDNLTPGTSYTWYLRYIDTVGNTSTIEDPNNVGEVYNLTLTTSSTVDAGIISFTASSFEEDEDNSPMAVTLQRIGGTTGIVQVTVSTLDATAIAGTNYTAEVNTVVQWADGNSDIKTVDTTGVVLSDQSSAFNNMFEIQIDDGSATNGSFIGSTNAALCKIISSVTAIGGYQQSSATGNVLCVEAENMSSFADSSSVVYTEITEEATGEDSNGKHMLCGEGTWGDATTYEADAPYLQATVNFVATGVHDIWLRMRANDSDNHVCHTDFDDSATPNATQLGFDGPIVGTDVSFYGTRKWIHKNAGGTDRVVTVSATGTHTIEIYGQQRKSRVDKIVFSLASSGYDPATAGADGPNAEDDKIGPDESLFSEGSVEDNPFNPTEPSTPPPSDSVTPTLSPLDAATDVATSTVFVATFTGKTVLTSTTATVTLDGGSDISGTVTVGIDSITFTPASPLGEGHKYLPVFTGTIRDTDGTTKSYDTTNWDVTVVTGSSAVFFENFNSRSTGAMTNALLETIFNANTSDGGYAGVDNMAIVADPESGGTRGNVLRITHPAGQYELGCSFKTRFSADNTNKTGSERHDEVWIAYDVYYSPGTEWQSAMKSVKLIAGTLLEASHSGDNVPNIAPEGVYAINSGTNMYNNQSYPAIPSGEAGIWNYEYTSDSDATDARVAKACNKDDPTVGIDGSLAANISSLPLMTTGTWHKFVRRLALNDAPTWSDSAALADGGADAGIIENAVEELWIDGVKIFSRSNREFRWTDALKCDGFWLYEYYNNRSTTPAPSADQYVYYDNFEVQTSAITP